MEPQKPFACSIVDCGMAFTNEDHLHVHTKKHDMVLQLGAEQKAAFVADQTPTPTRFIRNCEEVGLFQELQNVNPFDEGFKRAMETKSGLLSLDPAPSEELHTPQMVFPLLGDGDSSVYTSNNQRNITISRSSSDESGAIKEYETTTISKLRNEVTTISRIVGKHDILDKITTTDDVSITKHEEFDGNRDIVNETVSYTNNIIKIHSNVEIRTGNQTNVETLKHNIPNPISSYTDSVIKDNVIKKDVLLTDTNKLQVPDKMPPIMSQKSIDFVVDTLTNEHPCQHDIIDVETDKDIPIRKVFKRNFENAVKKSDEEQKKVATKRGVKLNDVAKTKNEFRKIKKEKEDDYEVIIKLPNQQYIRMKAVEEIPGEDIKPPILDVTKEKLKKALSEKVEKITPKIPTIANGHIISNILPGTLYPVTLVNPTQVLITNTLQKIPIPMGSFKKSNTTPTPEQNYKKTVKRKVEDVNSKLKKKEISKVDRHVNMENKIDSALVEDDAREVGKVVKCKETSEDKSTFAKHCLESRSAASRRYRERLKKTMAAQGQENQQLREENQRLKQENAALKAALLQHARQCARLDVELSSLQAVERTTGKQ